MLQELSINLFVVEFSQLLTILRKKGFFSVAVRQRLEMFRGDNFLNKKRFQ